MEKDHSIKGSHSIEESLFRKRKIIPWKQRHSMNEKSIHGRNHLKDEKYRKNLETAHLLYGGFKSMIIVIKYDKKGYAYEI